MLCRRLALLSCSHIACCADRVARAAFVPVDTAFFVCVCVCVCARITALSLVGCVQVLLLIFAALDDVDVAWAAGTCRRLRTVCRDQRLWRRLYCARYGEPWRPVTDWCSAYARMVVRDLVGRLAWHITA